MDDFASALSKGDRYNDQLADLAARNAGVDAAVFAVTTETSGPPATSWRRCTRGRTAWTGACPLRSTRG